MSELKLSCLDCNLKFELFKIRYFCSCGGLLEVAQNRSEAPIPSENLDSRLASRKVWDRSGVWRFREGLIPLPESSIVTQSEGSTPLHRSKRLELWSGSMHLWLKHEGENPTGSFKDRGMTLAVSVAKHLGQKVLACASTGNTSSSLASYAARAGLKSVVFLPSGKVSQGKLSQTLAYGAHVFAVKGDFDRAMEIVKQLAEEELVYLVNSINPFRIEGQKTIIWELLQDLEWNPPDWILVPGGNLGNTSAFGKAIDEAFHWGWIKKRPKIVTIQAAGASPFFKSYQQDFATLESVKAETIATAIRIGNPVNFAKARKAITSTGGLVESVTDSEIMEAKRQIDLAGIGCEPASATTLAGLKKLTQHNQIKPEESVILILTGHLLKDNEASMDIHKVSFKEVEPEISIIRNALREVC